MLIYLYEVATLACVFVIASISLNLIVGQAGLFSMAHGALLGIGAYAYALTTTNGGLSPIAAVAGAIIVTGAIGVLLAVLSVHLDVEQFAVTTLAFHLLVVNVMINWPSLTNGAYGVAQIPRIKIGIADPQLSLLIVTMLFAIATFFVYRRVARSGFGTLLMASASDPDMVRSLGGRVLLLLVAAFTAGSCGAGLAGALFAMQAGYIAPTLFELHLSVLILAMVILGGGRSVTGAAVGAVILISVPEALRFAAFSPVSAGPLRQVVLGCIIIAAIYVQVQRRSRRV